MVVAPVYNEYQKRVLRELAISASTLSIIAGGFMIYWFAKLRKKTFRHKLVMMLITSDFLKACAEIIYPAATIASGDTSPTTLCTVTGYISTVFVTSTDAAVLIIALHTALCIFRPQQGVSSEEGGLWKYRKVVYLSWALYSLTLPSLAFLNKQRAYVSGASWCFLPVRPFYWRIALSWGPRYVILLFILFLYLSIYIYVTKKFKSFSLMFAHSGIDDGSSEMSHDRSTFHLHEVSVNGESKVAELATHDLISDEVTDVTQYKGSPTTHIRELDGEGSPSLLSGSRTPISPPLARRASVISISIPTHLEGRRASVMSLGHGLGTFTRITPGGHGDESPNVSIHKLQDSHSQPRTVDPLRAQRQVIVKQLKYLFIFPIVYFVMWIIPFVHHQTQYFDKFITSPVFVLACCSAFIIPLHGLVDVLVYARQEKPWRSWRYNASNSKRSRRASRLTQAHLAGPAGGGHNSAEADKEAMDEVGRRHFEEMEEARAKRASRLGAQRIQRSTLPSTTAAGLVGGAAAASLPGVSGPREWWDLEEERNDTLSDESEDDDDDEEEEEDDNVV